MERGSLKASILLIITIMGLCLLLVPISAYFLDDWYAYWSHALLAVIFAVMAVLLRTCFYWEEE